jgi:uncharacterized membrane protein
METKKRTIFKTATFKVLAMITSYLTALFFTGSKETALFVVIANSTTTLFGFYIHERVWAKLDWNISENGENQKRTIVKTITYKLWIFTVGTLTKWTVVGNLMTALSIGITKNLITTVIYYLHERTWNKIKWGLKDKTNEHTT